MKSFLLFFCKPLETLNEADSKPYLSDYAAIKHSLQGQKIHL